MAGDEPYVPVRHEDGEPGRGDARIDEIVRPYAVLLQTLVV